MSFGPHDQSYLFTEYGRRKEYEAYEIEMKKKRLDDGEQEGNEYLSPVLGPGHQRPVEEAV